MTLTDFLEIKPLTKEAFASFGDVIEITPSSMRHINGGQTERHHALAAPEAAGEARVSFSIFFADRRGRFRMKSR